MAHRLGQCVYTDWFMIPVNELAWGLFHFMETGIYERCCGVYIVESLYKTICHNTLFCIAWQWQVRNVFCGYFGVTYPYYEMVDCTNQRATRLLHSLCDLYTEITHDDVIKWKHFPCYWPFVRGIHRSPVNSPHKGQWRRALMFSLICARINAWVNNG